MTEIFAPLAVASFATMDVIILVIVGLLAARGLLRGLVRDAVMAGGLFAAMIFTRVLAPRAQGVFGAVFHNETVARAIAFMFVFICLVVAAGFAARAARGIVKVVKLGSADRIAGMVCGALFGMIVSGLFCKFVASFMPNQGNGTFLETFIVRISATLTHWLLGL